MTEPKRILILSANPWGTQRLALDKEFSVIQKARDAASEPARFDIRLCPAATVEDLQAEMLKFRPQVVHFCGHGAADALAFSDDRNQETWVEQEAIVNLFRLASTHVECVVLNACWTAALADAISEHVGYVVGMARKIGDEAAIAFSGGFYRSLFAGNWYTRAFEHGRNAIQLKNIPEDLTPRLKIRKNAPRGCSCRASGRMSPSCGPGGMRRGPRPFAGNWRSCFPRRWGDGIPSP